METDVVVIGGGAAGLAAARAVVRGGRGAIVLEAREVPGGRIRTVHVPGLPAAIELGAEFVHGDARLSRRLWRRAGRRVEAMPDRHHRAGPRGPGRAEEPWDELGALLGSLGAEGPDRSVAAALDAARAEPRVIQLARAFLTGFDAVDPDLASARAVGGDEATGGAEGALRLPGGQDGIVEGLLEAPLDVRTRTIVQRVEHGGDGVVVEARDALGRPLHVSARAAIVALPLGVLHAGSVAFSPALDWPLDALRMGAVVRITLLFDHAVWRARVKRLAYLFGDGAFGAFWTMPSAAAGIVAWSGGPSARDLSRVPELQRVERAVADLAAALAIPERELVDHLRGWHHHDWVADPLALGAYSYVAVGGARARHALAEPRGRLLLAGEHVPTEGAVGSTVEAALRSGRRAGRHAVGLLR
jgi:monoamine oxidase